MRCAAWHALATPVRIDYLRGRRRNRAITTGREFFVTVVVLGEGCQGTYFQCRKLGRSRMRYLITGGAGFIGSHLIDALTTRGDDVLVLDDLSTGRIENLDHLDRDHDRDGPLTKRFAGHSRVGAVEFVDGSVTNEAVVDDCMSLGRRLRAPRLGGRRPARGQATARIAAQQRPRLRHRALGRGPPRPPAAVHLDLGDLRQDRAARRCRRARTGSSAPRFSRAGATRPRRPSARSSPPAITARRAPRRSSPGCSTRSARGRRAPTGWSCPDSSARPSTART